MPVTRDVREPLATSAESDSFASLLREAAEISEPSRVWPARLGLLPGDVLAQRFEIKAHVNSGGMGTIYRATDRLTGELVAIKVMTRCFRRTLGPPAGPES
jgi:serine/threonine protein kinase